MERFSLAAYHGQSEDRVPGGLPAADPASKDPRTPRLRPRHAAVTESADAIKRDRRRRLRHALRQVLDQRERMGPISARLQDRG